MFGLATSFQLFPNPAFNEVKLSWKANAEGMLELNLINMTGLECLRRSFNMKSESARISLSDIRDGIYWFNIYLGDNCLHRGKLVICR